jgi:zinc protease
MISSTIDISYNTFNLANGLTVLIHEDRKSPIVAVNTWYHVGSRNEPVGKTGLAHLAEHLMFSGSAHFNAQYINAMHRIGATDLSGLTSKDRTSFFQTVPCSMLEYTLFAESDRMEYLSCVIDQVKLDAQRNVVLNERLQGYNKPNAAIHDIILRNTYPEGHPYSWPVIGSLEDLSRISLNDVTNWFATFYRPTNATLVVAGDVETKTVESMVADFYGEIPSGPKIERPQPWLARRSGSCRSDSRGDRIAQPCLYRVWNVPQFGTKECAHLDLVAQILGGGRTSRLYKILVYEKDVDVAVIASNRPSEICGQFIVTLCVGPDMSTDRAEQIAAEETHTFIVHGPTDEELRIAKSHIVMNYVRAVERVGGFGGKSDILAKNHTFTGNPGWYKHYLSFIESATVEVVTQTAQAWLSDGDYVFHILP